MPLTAADRDYIERAMALFRIERATALFLKHQPRSDVKSRRQVVPCHCGRPIYCPQEASGRAWYALHSDRDCYAIHMDHESPPDSSAYHYAVAHAHVWRTAAGEDIILWLPEEG